MSLRLYQLGKYQQHGQQQDQRQQSKFGGKMHLAHDPHSSEKKLAVFHEQRSPALI
ncbi:hypothetical protein [Rhodoferax sp.]|uniref:hypothetical protein n=1 Tax=Rhodoferax sp. TaxID=50421 RepID=UPI0025DD29B4|nr:hypothetical protein [Rhodoferax sp.]